jgi:ribosomal protein S18 acetylase RimI-like enzyme
VRPGRKQDLSALLNLWHADVRAGKRDCVPGDAFLQRVMDRFDWESRSRVAESRAGALEGAVLVSNRDTPLGTVAGVEASAAEPELLNDLTRWGLGLSRAAGAVAAQVWRGRGHTGGLEELGLEPVRPWWRMDRSLTAEPSRPSSVDGYELRDASTVTGVVWADAHNLSFADHWRFSARTENELMAGRPATLSLMAVTPGGSAAALTLCQIEEYRDDSRSQPVGIISSVGTLPDHRRRGLATWLVAEALLRLHRHGAHHASLYVDGLNPTRAFDAYTKLGFDLAFETEVWEATFR